MRIKNYLERSTGSTIAIKELTTRDLIPVTFIRNHTAKEALELYKRRSTCSGYRVVAEKVGARIFRHFLHLVVNRLMEGDRLVLDDDLSLLIAWTKFNRKRVVNTRKKRQICWSNLGQNCGVMLHGMDHKYYFRMPRRRRLELASRIKAGQNFAKL